MIRLGQLRSRVFNRFLSEIQDPNFTINSYLDEREYEDEYGKNKIEEAMCILTEKISEYLVKNRPNEFVLTSGWCIYVMTLDEARKRFSEKCIEGIIVG